MKHAPLGYPTLSFLSAWNLTDDTIASNACNMVDLLGDRKNQG